MRKFLPILIVVPLLFACAWFSPGAGDPTLTEDVQLAVLESTATTGAALPAVPAAPTKPPATATPATATPAPTPLPPFNTQALTGDCAGGAFERIESLDYVTVRFQLCRPQADFLSQIAFPAFAIYPAEWLAQLGAQSELNNPPGSGRYRLQQWLPGEKLTLARFDDTWRESTPNANHPAEIVIRWDLDAALRLVELQAGTVDGIDNLSVDDFAIVEQDAQQQMLLRPALNVAYVGINNTSPPFDDLRVRQALALGIDRTALLAEAFPHGYEPALRFTPCIVPDGCSGPAWPQFDPAAGRQLLAQADYPAGMTIQLTYRHQVRGYLPWPDEAALALQQQLKQNLGMQVKLVVMPDDEFYAALDSGSLPGLYLLGWGADYPTVGNFLEPHFGPGATRQFGEPYSDLTQVLAQAAGVQDSPARSELYAQANTLLAQYTPLLPLAHGGWDNPNSLAVAYHANIQVSQVSPLGLEDFGVLRMPPGQTRFVWMQAAEPNSLYCAFATDSESLRACALIAEPLYRFQPGGGVATEPALAQNCTPSPDLMTWTCTLRSNVVFQDGTALDANDVLASFGMQWQPTPGVATMGEFAYFAHFFGR